MRYKFGILLFALLLSGCGTMAFKPMEYPLRDGLIPSLNINGEAKVSNAQPSKEQFIVYSYGGSKLASNLNEITDVMVQQTQKELQKNGQQSGSGSSKTISLKVNSLVSEYIAFYWKSNIDFDVTLGNGQTFKMKVPHGSGVLAQDLNGCIAEGVMNLLKDQRVRDYLGS